MFFGKWDKKEKKNGGNDVVLACRGGNNVANNITGEMQKVDGKEVNQLPLESKTKLLHINSVGLEYFEATTENNDVILNWKTNWEINNFGFKLQREAEYSGYQTIGFVSGYGTTNEEHTYSFIDNSLNNGNYKYRLIIIEFDGSFEYSSVIEVEVYIPLAFKLDQNYPNPFNPSTKIEYTIPTDGFTELKVYDIMGNSITTLLSEAKPAGSYEIVFDAN